MTRARTETDPRTPSLAAWVDSQLVMGGPTARECVLYSAIDDDAQDVPFYMYAAIIATDAETRRVTGRALAPYDPPTITGPWIAQTRRETIAHIVHTVNVKVAIAGALGASWVTTSRFRQRLLLRRGGRPAPAQALIRAGVPHLSGASSRAVARVAAVDETVEALREVTRESLHAMRDLPLASQREAAAELGRKLQARAEALRKDMARTRRWCQRRPNFDPLASVEN